MTVQRRLILATNDLRLAQVVQTHLQKSLLVNAPVIRFEDVPNVLTPETDGALLLLASEPADCAAIEQVVRESRIQLFPASITVLASEVVLQSRALDYLKPHLSGLWAWPHQARELLVWARRGTTPGIPFADPGNESVTDRIRRKLICQ